MPFAKLRQDYTPPQASQPAPQLTTELEGSMPIHSPARALQQQLARGPVMAPAVDVAKWSPRSSLALIVSVSAALWMAILMAGTEAAKMIA